MHGERCLSTLNLRSSTFAGVENASAVFAMDNAAAALHRNGGLRDHLHMAARADIVFERDDGFVFVGKETLVSVDEILVHLTGERVAILFNLLELGLQSLGFRVQLGELAGNRIAG